MLQKGLAKVEIIKHIRRMSESERTLWANTLDTLQFFTLIGEPTDVLVMDGTMGYSRNYGLRSELWGTVGTMGYGRSYGLRSELWALCVCDFKCFTYFCSWSAVCWPAVVSKLGCEYIDLTTLVNIPFFQN